MLATDYFDLATPDRHVSNRAPVAELSTREFTPSSTVMRPARITLDEILYTGQALTGNWRFAISMLDKVWLSSDMVLRFGHTHHIDKLVYTDKLEIVEKRLLFNLDVSASNRFGDVFHTSHSVRQCITQDRSHYRTLVQIDNNWSRLMLRFGIHLA